MSNPFEEAEGYYELELFVEAWEALENLPPEDRASPHVIAMRVRILIALNRSENARIVAEGLINQFPFVAASWLTMARVQVAEGNVDAAKESLSNAFTLDEDLRLDALEDPRLAEVWE
jgi:predicted Zn-dependent protease